MQAQKKIQAGGCIEEGLFPTSEQDARVVHLKEKQARNT